MKIDDRLCIKKATDGGFLNHKASTLGNSDTFSKLVAHEGQSLAYGHLAVMVTEIEKQGQRLAQSLSINEIRYYRKMISDFLQKALSVACTFEKESMSDNRGKLRKYTLVKKINQNVDDLMQKIIKEESSHIEVLKMLDDIRGLLLDLSL